MGALLVRGQIIKAFEEHSVMKIQLGEAYVSWIPKQRISSRLIVKEKFLTILLIPSPDFLHTIFHLFCTGHVIVFM